MMFTAKCIMLFLTAFIIFYFVAFVVTIGTALIIEGLTYIAEGKIFYDHHK